MMNRSVREHGTLQHAAYDTDKVGHGFKNMFDVCQTESLVQFAKSRPQRLKYSCTHPLIVSIVPNMMFIQILRRKQTKTKYPAISSSCYRFRDLSPLKLFCVPSLPLRREY